MNRIKHLSLILIIALQSGGIILLLHGKKAIHKTRIERLLEANLPVTDTIVFSDAEFEAIVHDDHEFSWQGRKFDIISIEKTNAQVIINAYHDAHEESIEQRIELYMRNLHGTENNQAEKQSISELLSMHYLVPEIASVQAICCAISAPESHYRMTAQSFNCTLHAPPPEC